MDFIITFFRDVLNGPLYIIVAIICGILICSCIGYLAERSINKKKQIKEHEEKYANVSNMKNNVNIATQQPDIPVTENNASNQISNPFNNSQNIISNNQVINMNNQMNQGVPEVNINTGQINQPLPEVNISTGQINQPLPDSNINYNQNVGK